MSRSTFPTTIDTFTTKVDITSADVVNVNRYRELKNKTSLTASEQAELSSLVVTLANKMMSPDDFNKLQDCIVALEVFVKNNVDGYFQTAQANALVALDAEIANFQYKGEYNSATNYKHMNVLKYNGNVYFCEQDCVGILPTDTSYFTLMAEKGSKGENGLGIVFRGSYNPLVAYNVNEAVSYDSGSGHKIYYAISSTLGNDPSNTSFWDVFLDIGQFSALIGNMASLNTTAKDTIVNAINEVISEALELGETSTTAYRGDRGKIAYDHSQSVDHAPQNIEKFIPASGTATAIILTTGYFNLINNQSITFIASANNNGATTTINADSKGARNVYKPNTTTAPTFIAGKAYTVWYNATNACFFIKASAEGNTVVGHVLAGDTFSNDSDTGLTGTMPNRGTVNKSLAINGEYTIPSGYHSGLGKVTQNVPVKSAQTYTPSQFAQTIASGQYLTGNQTISSVSFDASKVLTGTTIAGKAGTMPNRGSQTATLSIAGSTKPTKSILAGYTSGGTVTAQVNANQASNIKEGYNLGGCIGSLVIPISYSSTWTKRNSGFGSTDINGVTYGNGMFVAVGGTFLTTSTDGINWTLRTSGFGSTGEIKGVCYGNGMFVAVGRASSGNPYGKITTSTDGINWTERTSGIYTAINGVAYGNGMFVAVGASTKLVTSPDGINWTQRTGGFGTSYSLYGVAYGDGMFVAVGESGTIVTSTDGINWTERTSGIYTDINGVAYGNGMFVAVGASTKLVTSPDGISWTQRTSNLTSILYGATYGNGMFVVVGYSGIATSPDGINWVYRYGSVLHCVTYGNSMFVAVGGAGNLVTLS